MLRSLLPILLVAGMAACARDSAETTAVDRETFVQTYVELRRATLDHGGTPAFQARKEEILARHGTSEEELRAFLRAHEDDPAYLSGLWEEIADRSAPSEDADAAP